MLSQQMSEATKIYISKGSRASQYMHKEGHQMLGVNSIRASDGFELIEKDEATWGDDVQRQC